MREPRPGKRSDAPIPHDREDQQAAAGEDPSAIPLPGEGVDGSGRARPDTDDEGGTGGARGRDAGLPDMDVAGTGPRGSRRHGTIHPEHPSPDEPTD